MKQILLYIVTLICQTFLNIHLIADLKVVAIDTLDEEISCVEASADSGSNLIYKDIFLITFQSCQSNIYN